MLGPSVQVELPQAKQVLYKPIGGRVGRSGLAFCCAAIPSGGGPPTVFIIALQVEGAHDR